MTNLNLFFRVQADMRHPALPPAIRANLRAIYAARATPIVGSYDRNEREIALYLNERCVWRKVRVLTGDAASQPEEQTMNELMGEVLTEAIVNGLHEAHKLIKARDEAQPYSCVPYGVFITSNYLFDGASPDNEILPA